MSLEEHAETGRRRGVPALDRSPVGGLGARQISAFFKQDANAEGAGGLATFIRPAERILGAGLIAALLEEHAQVQRGGRDPALISAPVGRFGFLELA